MIAVPGKSVVEVLKVEDVETLAIDELFTVEDAVAITMDEILKAGDVEALAMDEVLTIEDVVATMTDEVLDAAELTAENALEDADETFDEMLDTCGVLRRVGI